jgi:hypothetical protein
MSISPELMMAIPPIDSFNRGYDPESPTDLTHP